MKKWAKAGFAATIATTMMVPAMASAATFEEVQKIQKGEKPDLLKEILGSKNEQKVLAYKKLQEKKEQLSDDTIVIKYDKALPKSVHQKAGTSLVKSIPALGYDIVKLKKGQKLNSAIAYYSSLKQVKSANQSVQYKALNAGDPKKSDQYHQSLLKIDEALKLAGKNSVTVAVIDSGLDNNHPELKANLLPPYNAADPANGAFTDLHGTHVAGIVAGGANNGIGGQGVAPNAKILPIDVFNGGWGASDYIIAEGIMYAIEKGADVINMSLGGYMESSIFEEAVQKAIDAGITVVAAAGNEETDEYSSPAHYDGVISVGATNDKNELAWFSNYGPSVDIVAPGEDIYSTAFDYQKGTSFMKLSGTSMASPVVAGVVALLKSKYPDLKPFEVEYILEQTATDLGEKGYDLTFANGLVNPVAALKYDIKNLPKYMKLTEEEKLKNAKDINKDGENVFNGALQKLGEDHYYKVKLSKGELLQTVLEGSDKYDMALELQFIPDTAGAKKAKPIKVNDAKAGSLEGYLYKAEENGTLLITVKDANGNYDANGKSKYTFKATKLKEIHMDDSSQENMTQIDAIPYKSSKDKNGPFTLYAEGEEADKDYFTFTVEEPQILSVDLAGVPGVDATLALFFKEDFDGGRPEDLSEYEMWPEPMQIANQGGKGQAERLVFEAVPGMEYVLEVAGAPTIDYLFFDPFFMGFNFDTTPGTSSIPYDLNINSLELPPDEDGYPIMGDPEDEYMDEKLTEAEYKAVKKDQLKKRAEADEDYYRMFEREQVDLIVDSAVPFEIGKDVKGYFQYEGDEDFYTFTAEKDYIYEFDLTSKGSQYLNATFYEYDEKNHDLSPIADISYWSGSGMKTPLTLEKDKSYYVQMRSEMGGISAEPYVLKSKALVEPPKEDDNDNNEMIRAKVINVGTSHKNYLYKNSDVDYYYYKHRADDKVLNLQLTPQPFTEQEKKTLPKSVQNPLFLYTIIIEDTNGNMNIDEEEAAKAVSFGPSNEVTYEVNASFKAKKNAGYFIMNTSDLWGEISLQPYHIQLNDLTRADEDKDSVVKNNVPSKPLSLKNDKGILKATGYFNMGVDFGDKDYYVLNMDKKGNATITLKTDSFQDGVIKVFNSQGTLVKEFDYYGVADTEVGTVSLEKGKYYIEISEAMARASIKPYELMVQVK